MSDEYENAAAEAASAPADAPHPNEADSNAADPAGEPGPVDPVARELAPVEDAMVAVRGAAPGAEGEPTVPADDEVAALEHAHDVLRSTLDRVERGG